VTPASTASLNDFSLYDQMLDMSCLLLRAAVSAGRRTPICTPTSPWRAARKPPPMEMTKWFDTNYHYIVPEFAEGMRFRIGSTVARRGRGARGGHRACRC
jgi:5-methyltetrahydropteroyltriglutamate--homocysteine methyltransferase